MAIEAVRPAQAKRLGGPQEDRQVWNFFRLSRTLAGPLDSMRERAERWPSHYTPSAVEAGRSG